MPRVLVVDDVEENVYLLKLILERHGHKPIVAYSGKEALEIIAREDVDLVLLDVMMPEVSGMEVAAILKGSEKTRHIPIIFLTARKRDAEDVAEGLAAGADEYITKPFHETELIARANSMLRMKRLYDEVASAKNLIEEELRMAQAVQFSMLPTKFPYPDKMRFHAHYRATSAIGGDYYDVLDYGDGKVGMMVADVSGHGPSAALVVSMVKTIMHSSEGAVKKPKEIVEGLNSQLHKIIQEEQYVTLFFGILDLNSGSLSYVRAGHPFPFLISAGGKSARRLEAEGEFVGFSEDIHIEQEQTLMRPGDRLLMYSDGLIEVADSDGAMFGLKRLQCSLETRSGQPGEELIEGIMADAGEFNSEEAPWDDVAILLAEII